MLGLKSPTLMRHTLSTVDREFGLDEHRLRRADFSASKSSTTRKHSSRMRTNRTITRPSSEPVSMRPIVDRQTPVKTLPSLAVGNNHTNINFTHNEDPLITNNFFEKLFIVLLVVIGTMYFLKRMELVNQRRKEGAHKIMNQGS